ncbi:MAG: hypothetical protein LBT16_04265 [Treponema sp.]|nr:hypothetical protein [Treponema sp.]
MTNRRCALKGLVFSVAILALSALISACATAKPVSPEDLAGFPLESEDINGYFPDTVYIKTRTQTFNAYHYYLLQEGRIWYKSIDRSVEPKDWTIFDRTGLPHSAKPGFHKTDVVAEISADADELVALSAEGGFYRYCFDKTIAHKSNVWLDRQGWPIEEQLYIDERVAKNRTWAMGKRNMQVLYYEDPFGNQHHNGTQEIATTYALLEDGREICYADTGLPSDFSRNYAGPERGAFKAASFSASASTLFVINEAGVMYTRIADFDIIGCDPMFFKYTYVPYTSGLAGTNYFSNLTEWGLPPEDWRAQPRIPLAGKAAITRHITILQNGQGNGARELRVAGFNEQGETGYWTKAIFAGSWEFKTVPLYFHGTQTGRTTVNEGSPPDKRFSGYWWNGNEREYGWTYEIPNFNILEGDCDFRITWYGETCVLKLYPVELWTYIKRDYLPGRTGAPKLFFVTLDIPENAFTGLSEEFTNRLREKFARKDKVLFQFTMAASTRYIFMRDKNDIGSVLFLTDGTLSDYFPEFRRTWYIENYDELRRYHSPELTFDDHAILTREQYEELCQKIEMNKTFLRELKARISLLRRNKFSAITLDMVYIPLHYIGRFTPLRFIDAPKIRTMTNYGNEIVLANSAYTDIVSNTRIWVDKKIIELLETRILMFEETAKQFEKTKGPIAIPHWFSEAIAGYWDIAGLPHKVSGTFYNPALPLLLTGQIPAVLTFTKDKTGQDFGWYFTCGEFAPDEFTIGENASFSFFLDPRKSAKTIYSRGGKTPAQRTVRLDCTLYANPGINTAIERNIVERCLAPLVRADREGIDVRITFDGNAFEIREHPAAHGNTLIFRGQRIP